MKDHVLPGLPTEGRRALTAAALVAALAGPMAGQAVGDTSFSVKRGFYSQPLDVVINTSTAGATIRYTLDGSDPTTSGNRAEGPAPLTVRIDPASTNGSLRELTPAVTLRAYALRSGMAPSNVDTQTYVFVDRVLTQTRPSGYPTGFDYDVDQNVVNDARYRGRIRGDLLSIPSLSVVTSVPDMFGAGGLMTAQASTIERPGSIEIIYPDGRDGAQAACGFKPHSHVLRKRSLRAYFRGSVYGTGRFKHDLFRDAVEGVDFRARDFDVLVLRAGVNDNLQSTYDGRASRATYLTDQLARSSQAAMSGFGQRGAWVHLYVNGLYWGLYNLAERPDDAFSASQFGGVESDWFAINHGGELSGDPSWYNGLVAGARNFATLTERLDFTAFADYILYYCYCGGGDWPENNWYASNRVLPTPGKVRWYIWDCEDSWIRMPGRANDGAWIHPNLIGGTSNIATVWRGADDFDDFRILFADRVYKHCFNDGALTEAAIIARFDALCAQIDSPIVGESARWGRFKGGGGLWTRDDDWLPYKNSVRSLMVGNVQRLLTALRDINQPSPHPKYYPDTEPPAFKSGGATLGLTKLTILPNFPLRLEAVGGQGTVYFTLDGTDPRASGGAPRGANAGTGTDLTITATTVLNARTLRSGEWSALHTLTLDVAPGLAIEIHEFMAQNDTGIRDETGAREDWIELWNKAPLPLDLGGYCLTDDLSRPTKWRFPAGTVVPAGSTLLVWADDETSQGPLHTNFKLSASGEVVALFDPSGLVFLDGVQFGAQNPDISLGRLAGSDRSWFALASPTPRRPNVPEPCGHLNYAASNRPAMPFKLQGEGTVRPEEALSVSLRGALPGSPLAFFVGLQPAAFDLGFVGTALVVPLFVLQGSADAEGKALLSLRLPSDPVVRGLDIYTQAVVASGAVGGLTGGVASRVCP